MGDWIDFELTLPERLQACDFLFDGDEEEEHVWMLCRAIVADTYERHAIPRYWRPAAELPTDISHWYDKLKNEPR